MRIVLVEARSLLRFLTGNRTLQFVQIEIELNNHANIGDCTIQSFWVQTIHLDYSQLTLSLFWIHFPFFILFHLKLSMDYHWEFCKKRGCFRSFKKKLFSETAFFCRNPHELDDAYFQIKQNKEWKMYSKQT